MNDLAAAAVDNGTVRVLERDSIRAFVASCADYLTGDVLDFGCGQQPYRDLVPGRYHPFDRADFPANVSQEDIGDGKGVLEYDRWDAILCNQVIQYVSRPLAMLVSFRFALRPGGHLILTGPTNWAEVEPEDLHRYTLAGIRRLLEDAGYEVIQLDRRAHLDLGGFRLSLGYGALALKP